MPLLWQWCTTQLISVSVVRCALQLFYCHYLRRQNYLVITMQCKPSTFPSKRWSFRHYGVWNSLQNVWWKIGEKFITNDFVEACMRQHRSRLSYFIAFGCVFFLGTFFPFCKKNLLMSRASTFSIHSFGKSHCTILTFHSSIVIREVLTICMEHLLIASHLLDSTYSLAFKMFASTQYCRKCFLQCLAFTYTRPIFFLSASKFMKKYGDWICVWNCLSREINCGSNDCWWNVWRD